jgi:hypothetical protein
MLEHGPKIRIPPQAPEAIEPVADGIVKLLRYVLLKWWAARGSNPGHPD